MKIRWLLTRQCLVSYPVSTSVDLKDDRILDRKPIQIYFKSGTERIKHADIVTTFAKQLCTRDILKSII